LACVDEVVVREPAIAASIPVTLDGARALPITLEDVDGRSVLRVEGDIEIASAAELKAALIEAISSTKEVQVDLRGARDFDVTAVQLLWAAARDAGKAGIAFAVAGESIDILHRIAAEMGFENFGLPKAEQAAPAASAAMPAKSADDR